MNGAKGLECAICYDSICSDLKKIKRTELTCGHAFGKSCIRKWVESSNQKKCPVCTTQLTDKKIKEIKNIPLQERVVIFLEKMIKLTGRTIVDCVPAFAVPGAFLGAALWATVGAAEAAAAGVIVIAAPTVFVTAGAAAGAVAASAGVPRNIGIAAGAAVGAAVGATVAVGGLAVAASAGVFGAASGGIRDAFFFGTAAGCGAIAGNFIGGITAESLYSQQESNPVVV
ncbi:E3 ubiquitin protein ligase [Thalassotalea sp. G20_0]|nr:E3 ubiquitin protein ligase [Thalassotalea sp. G20_0]